MNSETPELVEIPVVMRVSKSTELLWLRAAARMGFPCFDDCVQALALLGAAALAQVDLGVIPAQHLEMDADKLRSIVWTWLRKTFTD